MISSPEIPTWPRIIFLYQPATKTATTSSQALNTCHLSFFYLVPHSPQSSAPSHPTQFRYPLTEILAQNSLYDGRLDTSVCNGILCFRLPNCVGILCNPSIRTLKILPPLKFSVISYTLGYDCNNYKVIALTKGIGKVHVHVHAFGTNSWRMIEDFPDPNFINYAPGTMFMHLAQILGE
ncbi:hypothetical protein KIW84_063148 [Lathyrus oleraceus]|uniref:F-box associated beta-propeller type 3 domain-containing protein n=1 Tax=Pisum sativum TaxID=3888 RepID=A0A9D4WAR1_PEA|nr:hypothetical protein KIW84_063148 [Pisum sativum]